jgi:uncharacterized protein YecE (DUF72 family)
VAGVKVRVGTTGWGIASRYLEYIPAGGSHLARYAKAFGVTEIATSFYRHHQRETCARWARSVSPNFRFAVKTPRALTHEGSLVHKKSAELDRFLLEIAGLGRKLRVVLVQLPPSLQYDAGDCGRFFRRLRRRMPDTVAIVCEPRHESWNSQDVDGQLRTLKVSRAAVDPARWDGAARPGGDGRLQYFRMHGSPRIYYSDYEPQRLEVLTAVLQEAPRSRSEVWCIFDNTALGHALGNALFVQGRLAAVAAPTG